MRTRRPAAGGPRAGRAVGSGVPAPDRPPVPSDPSPADPVAVALARLHAGGPSGGESARWAVVEAVFENFRGTARARRRGRRDVRRWEQTGDVLAEAAVRLHQALGTTTPDHPGGVVALMAKKVREVTIDLARRHTGAGGFGGNHHTAAPPPGSAVPAAVRAVATETASPATLAEWTAFHEAAGELPEDTRSVWDLRFYAGLSEEETAARLGVTARTVRRRYRDGKIALAPHLPGHPGGPK